MNKKQMIVIKTEGYDLIELKYYADSCYDIYNSKLENISQSPYDFFATAMSLIDDLATEIKQKGFYTGKVVCTKSILPSFTVGKIYEWKNGRTVTNRGEIFPIESPLLSFDDIVNVLKGALNFVELVE